MSRRGRGGLTRLDSPPPINRYAGDWSICGRNLLSGQEADYDEVAGSESDTGNPMSHSVNLHLKTANPTFHHVAVSGSGDEEDVAEKKGETWSQSGEGGGRGGLYMDDFLDFDAPFNCRLSLKDFDTLIHDLDRELAKQINICL